MQRWCQVSSILAFGPIKIYPHCDTAISAMDSLHGVLCRSRRTLCYHANNLRLLGSAVFGWAAWGFILPSLIIGLPMFFFVRSSIDLTVSYELGPMADMMTLSHGTWSHSGSINTYIYFSVRLPGQNHPPSESITSRFWGYSSRAGGTLFHSNLSASNFFPPTSVSAGILLNIWSRDLPWLSDFHGCLHMDDNFLDLDQLFVK